MPQNLFNGLLAGQKALVTGANSGIGTAIAKSLAKAGASVVVNFVTEEDKAEEVVNAINTNGGEAIALYADVSNEEQVHIMFRKMFETYGTIDILINNAGIQQDAPFQDMTLAQWNRVLSVNLTGQFLCAREAVREFLRRGQKTQTSSALGKIICISSVHDTIPWAGHVNYAVSKAGISMLIKTMAQELGPQHIRVNSISPGAIKTPINTAAWNTPETEDALLQLIPYGRIGHAEEIGKMAVWLASDESDYVTGATFYVDGGMMLYPGFRTGG
ncbi:SDR family oxidoreductase [Candidatus Nitrospira salsa]